MNLIHLALGIILTLVQPVCASSHLMMGAIQFPHELSTAPSIRVYCGGRKITCQTDKESNTITFNVPRERKQNVFHILITPGVSFEMVQAGIIGHMSVRAQQAYKLFACTLTENATTTTDPSAEQAVSWNVENVNLPENGRVPDNAVIVYYDPECIAKPHGGNNLELPTIEIKKDVLNIVGSETKLYEISNELLLAALNNDAFHAPAKEKEITKKFR